jgi:DNA-directed RNA polymerase subunit N (RpoN/RPB10)
MVKNEYIYRVLVGKSEERDILEDLGVDRRII